MTQSGNAQTMRLFCFHHAGGSGLAFKGWDKILGPDIEVVRVEIPSRERFSTLRELVKEINEEFRTVLDEPHMFFGHSFGALVAYRLASERAAEGSTLPRAMFLSSYAPPHLPQPLHMVDDLDDEQLAALLTGMGGMPAQLTRWPSLRENAIKVARNDLRLCNTDEEVTETVLPCPIHVFGGSDDWAVTESHLHEWRSRTSSDFSVNVLAGDHFYLRNRQPLLAMLRPLLEAHSLQDSPA